MIKHLLILINSVTLFLFGLFQTEDPVKLSGLMPASATAGQEVSLELRLSKGSRAGFAKLQLDLPPGFVVKEAEEKGANFSFDEGVAKWVWASLPEEADISIRVSLVPSESAAGNQQIAAKYSYVENNVKQVVDMDPLQVTVLSAGADNTAAVTHAAVTETPRDSVNRPQADTLAPAGSKEPAGDVKVERLLAPGESINEFRITIKITKGSTRGFARFSDDIAPGLKVKSLKTDGSSFSVADGKLKFVWVNVPEKEELEISYLLSSASTDPIILRGEYSYLEDNQSKKFRLDPESIAFQRDNTAAADSSKKETKEEPAENLAQKEEPVRKDETSLSRNESAVIYHVQVGAFKKGRNAAERLRKKFGITESLRSEMQEGYTKLMVGSFDTYAAARAHRESVKSGNGVKSAFVVAYHLGKRITVQEALMISKQQWFK